MTSRKRKAAVLATVTLLAERFPAAFSRVRGPAQAAQDRHRRRHLRGGARDQQGASAVGAGALLHEPGLPAIADQRRGAGRPRRRRRRHRHRRSRRQGRGHAGAGRDRAPQAHRQGRARARQGQGRARETKPVAGVVSARQVDGPAHVDRGDPRSRAAPPRRLAAGSRLPVRRPGSRRARPSARSIEVESRELFDGGATPGDRVGPLGRTGRRGR